jgi:virulence-associated protein VapD
MCRILFSFTPDPLFQNGVYVISQTVDNIQHTILAMEGAARIIWIRNYASW